MIHILEHTLRDSLKMLPFLFGAYLLLEYMEHRAPGKLRRLLAGRGHSRLGVAAGALLGCLPQCGFSVAAANLYAGHMVTMGTLAAVFLSTSDEALPVLLAHPESWGSILPLLLCKVAVAITVGLAVDHLGKKHQHHTHSEECIAELCGGCGCGHHKGILRPALWHTAHIFLFVLLVTFLLTWGIETLGEERLAAFLLADSLFQPVLAALFGFLPNCAASVVLVELYLAGSLSFGSAVAGLCTGAGVGLAVLWRANRSPAQNLQIMAVLFGAGSFTGILLQLLM